MVKKENQFRFPRPMGLTALATAYRKDKTDENKQALFNYIIHNWILSNGKFGNVSMDVNTLAKTTGMTIEYIQTYMRDQILTSKIWQPELQQDLINGLLGQQLSWALEDRMEINQQLEILKVSQGGHYTPFISAEMNKALKLRLESSTSLQQVIRTFTGGSTTNIFNQFNQQNNVQNQGISREEAIQLITEHERFLENKSDQAKYLEQAYDLKQLPSVVANEDVTDTDGAGFNVNRQELNEITDDYKGALKLSSKERHEMRREIEMNIDPDEEDPEFDSFEDITEDKDTGSIAESYLT